MEAACSREMPPVAEPNRVSISTTESHRLQSDLGGAWEARDEKREPAPMERFEDSAYTWHLKKYEESRHDAETARVLLSVAKEFFGGLMKAKGRRCDIQRNAFVAGLVALIPRDIFENRQGRAAMRLLGLSYRQVKLGSGERAVMEDCGNGFSLRGGGL